MKVRVLGADRSALEGLPVPDLWPLFPHDRVKTVVVESAGVVAGTMTVVLVPHIEATWIAPGCRNAGVSRALWRRTLELAREGGADLAFGSAGDEVTGPILERLGGAEVPARFYLLHVGEIARQDQSRALETPAYEPAGRV